MLKRIATVSLASKLLAEYEQIAELAVNQSFSGRGEDRGRRLQSYIEAIKDGEETWRSLLDTVLIKSIVLGKESFILECQENRRCQIALVDSSNSEGEKTEFDAKIKYRETPADGSHSSMKRRRC